jgi:hypothetical protein
MLAEIYRWSLRAVRAAKEAATTASTSRFVRLPRHPGPRTFSPSARRSYAPLGFRTFQNPSQGPDRGSVVG